MGRTFYLVDKVNLTQGQRRTIQKAWLDQGADCRVFDQGNGWVYVESGLTGTERGDGHCLDADGDYRFPGGGKIKMEDL